MDLQRMHEEEFEREREAAIERRFKPEVLDRIRMIEDHAERTSNSVVDALTALEEIKGALHNIDAALRIDSRRLDPVIRRTPPILYVIAALLAIIVFK